MDLKEAIIHAINGDAILFAGAGFSSGVKNQKGENFKRARELCELLCDELEIEFYDDLAYISNKYISEYGPEQLIELLQSQFISKEPLTSHVDIAKISWKRIYTTNYDDVIEKASDKSGQTRIPITLSQNARDSIKKSNLIIHLNGYIKSLTPDKLHKEFKLSRESYINESFTESNWATLFKHDVDHAKVIIFIGYSLQYDLDIQRIIGTSDSVKRKCVFVTREGMKGIELDRMKEIGSVYPIGTQNFSSEINEIEQSYIPIENNENQFDYFTHLNKTTTGISPLKDKDLSDLFIKGKIKFSHVFNYADTERYLVKREQYSNAISSLKNGKKAIIVHSNLGNGKTIFLNLLQSELIKQGQEVFVLDDSSEEYEQEIEKLSEIKGDVVVFIENYNLHLRHLRCFKIFNSPRLKFVLTARSFIHDNFYHRLVESMGLDEQEIMIFEINKLSDVEIDSLVKLLNSFQLWGASSTLSEKDKKILLKKQYNGSFQSILLGLLDSEIMATKIREIVNTIEIDDSVREIVYAAFISNIIGLNLRLDKLLFLLNDNSFSARIMNDPGVNELINIRENEIVVKSSVLGQHIMLNTKHPHKTINLLIKLMHAADAKNIKREYEEFLKLLVSFSNLRMLLNEHDSEFPDNIIRYYENIKNLEFNRKNPFFWLQYAIARLDLKQYQEAKIYFENAYAYAKEKNIKDNFQLDTHYARYLLENEIYNGIDENAAFQNFYKAHNLIYDNKNKKYHLHYPLKYGRYYLDIYIKFYKSFTDSAQNKFVQSCHQILEKISFYKDIMSNSNRSIHPDVHKSEKCIQEVLTKIRTQN